MPAKEKVNGKVRKTKRQKDSDDIITAALNLIIPEAN